MPKTTRHVESDLKILHGPHESKYYGMYSDLQRREIRAVLQYTRPDGSFCYVTEIKESLTEPIQNNFPDSVCLGEVVSFVKRIED